MLVANICPPDDPTIPCVNSRTQSFSKWSIDVTAYGRDMLRCVHTYSSWWQLVPRGFLHRLVHPVALRELISCNSALFSYPSVSTAHRRHQCQYKAERLFAEHEMTKCMKHFIYLSNNNWSSMFYRVIKHEWGWENTKEEIKHEPQASVLFSSWVFPNLPSVFITR